MSDEYPKAITVDGVPVTVLDAADEARWRAPPVPVAAVPDPVSDVAPVVESEPATEPDSPLDDVTLVMDNPAFDPPKKKAAKKK